LNYYHYGRAESTGSLYNGLDIRGEVVLLTRNVRIVGDNSSEYWGGQVLTGFAMENDGTFRYGHTDIDSIEIYNCS
jgi:hypothetical protein